MINIAILCPGQGAQAVGMGKAWFEACEAARRTFDEADEILGDRLGAPLGSLCFSGPADRLTTSRTRQIPYTWSKDGSKLLFGELDPETGWDIKALRWDEPTSIETLKRQPVNSTLRCPPTVGGLRTSRMSRGSTRSTCRIFLLP